MSKDLGLTWGLTLVARYRQYAANCLNVAKEVGDPNVRASLVDMAQVWVTLAEQTETEDTTLPQFLAPQRPRAGKDREA